MTILSVVMTKNNNITQNNAVLHSHLFFRLILKGKMHFCTIKLLRQENLLQSERKSKISRLCKSQSNLINQDYFLYYDIIYLKKMKKMISTNKINQIE